MKTGLIYKTKDKWGFMEKHLKQKGHLLALITILIWGTASVSSKILINSFSPVELFFYRIIIAYGALLIICPRFIKYKSLWEEFIFAGAGLTGVTMYFIFQNTALVYTYASNTAVLISVSPFFTAVLAHFFLKDEELSVNFFIGFAISILGIILIGYNGNHVLRLNPIGDIFALLSALAWALYCILMKKISTYKYNPILYTRKIIFYGIIFLIPVMVYDNFQFSLEQFDNMGNILNMLYLGLGASAATYVTWNYALGILGAVKTSAYLYISPIITIIVSTIVLKEKVTIISMLGVALILAGIYLSEKKLKRQKDEELCPEESQGDQYN